MELLIIISLLLLPASFIVGLVYGYSAMRKRIEGRFICSFIGLAAGAGSFFLVLALLFGACATIVNKGH